MRPGESCRTCVYAMGRENVSAGRWWTECHRYAPRPQKGIQVTYWPKVSVSVPPHGVSDWCGEYVQAPEPAA